MNEEDLRRIAKELGAELPEEEIPKPVEKSVEKPVEKAPEKKILEKPSSTKIANGFSFGFNAALGFWFITTILAILWYLTLKYLELI
jgi:hypothetical protein